MQASKQGLNNQKLIMQTRPVMQLMINLKLVETTTLLAFILL